MDDLIEELSEDEIAACHARALAKDQGVLVEIGGVDEARAVALRLQSKTIEQADEIASLRRDLRSVQWALRTVASAHAKRQSLLPDAAVALAQLARVGNGKYEVDPELIPRTIGWLRRVSAERE